MGLFSGLFGSNMPVVGTIEAAQPATMLVHTDRGRVARQLSNNTEEYWFEECAAEELCCAGTTFVEIKDITGKIYRYDHAAMVRLKWF
jgi:hypothetical protein